MSTTLYRLVFAGLSLTSLGFPAQVPGRPEAAPDIRVGVNLVLVPVTVVDQRGAFVGQLSKSHFQVFEDSIPQQIVAFSREEAPCSVGLVLDTSGSMREKLPDALAAVSAFLKTINADDEALLATFSGRPDLEQGFSGDGALLAGRLPLIRAAGDTALVDAVWYVLDKMRKAHNGRRAMIVVTDGQDNHSRFEWGPLLRRALEADVQIYVIAMPDSVAGKKPLEIAAEREGLLALTSLAENTGGAFFAVRGSSDSIRAAERIGFAIRNLYVIGYSPSGGRDGWRRIRLHVDVPKVRWYARSRYFNFLR
jgi:Ca-activated chloride channel family protein